VYIFISELLSKFQEFIENGASINLSSFNFDLFFWDFNIVTWSTIVIVLAIVFASYMGDKLSGFRNLRIKDLVFYTLLYGLISSVWLTVSVYKTVVGSSVKWVKVNK